MARTSGHGNPNWTRDEIILALDLYFQLDGQIPSTSAPAVRNLSTLLRSLPYHQEAAKRPSFRNADGVGFKLQNLRQVATGKGLGNVSAMDRRIWEEFGDNPDHVRRLAEAIRTGIELIGPDEISSDAEELPEGKILTALHTRRERNPKVRKLLLDKHRGRGFMCEMCDLHRPDLDPELQEAMFEAHHIVPLAEAGERKTVLADLALLCACCHRIIHSVIASSGRWLTVEEARLLVRPG